MGKSKSKSDFDGKASVTVYLSPMVNEALEKAAKYSFRSKKKESLLRISQVIENIEVNSICSIGDKHSDYVSSYVTVALDIFSHVKIEQMRTQLKKKINKNQFCELLLWHSLKNENAI